MPVNNNNRVLVLCSQVFELEESQELNHCCASLVNKLPHLADRLQGVPGQQEGGPGQQEGGPGQPEGGPSHSVERVGMVAHGLALRGTEAFLPWMARLLHFLDTEETGTVKILLKFASQLPVYKQ